MSPQRRREAVCMLQRRLSLSERRACQIIGQDRSTQRYEPKPADDDAELRRTLRRIASAHKRWGYRRAHGHLVNAEGWKVNRKRVQRVWREEGLRVPQKAPPISSAGLVLSSSQPLGLGQTGSKPNDSANNVAVQGGSPEEGRRIHL